MTRLNATIALPLAALLAAWAPPALAAAPTVTAGGTTPYAENGGPVAVDTALGVEDPDSADLVGAEVRVAAGLTLGDELVFSDQNGITGNYDAGTGVLTLSGVATVAEYQTALQSVSFRSTSESP